MRFSSAGPVRDCGSGFFLRPLPSSHPFFLVITLFSASPVNTPFISFLHPPLLLSLSSACPVSRWKQPCARQMKINHSEIHGIVVLILIIRMPIYEWIDSGTRSILWLFRMAGVEVTDLLTRSIQLCIDCLWDTSTKQVACGRSWINRSPWKMTLKK